jgi:hypothetical protein
MVEKQTGTLKIENCDESLLDHDGIKIDLNPEKIYEKHPE